MTDNSPLDATGDDGGEPVDATGDDVDNDATGDDRGKHVDATGDDVDEPLDATGDDGDEQVDATGNGVLDEQVDATGDNGCKHVCKHVDATGDDVLDEPFDATGDDSDEQVDATGNDGGKHVDAATGDDGDEQVDATGDEGNDDNRFVCTIVNHPGPCGWKIVHQCICKYYEVPIQCKGNENESCLCLVHPECMMLWERSSPSAITPLDPLSQFNLVCPMHHPQFKKPYKSDMPYLKQRNHPSPMNRQTLTQPPTSIETEKPNEKYSFYSSPSDSSTSSSNSNSDQSQSSKSKK